MTMQDHDLRLLFTFHSGDADGNPLCGVKPDTGDKIVELSDYGEAVTSGQITTEDAKRRHWRRVGCDWCITEQFLQVRDQALKDVARVLNEAFDELPIGRAE